MSTKISNTYICPNCQSPIVSEGQPKNCPACKYQFGVLTVRDFKWLNTPFQQYVAIALKRQEEMPPFKNIGENEVPKQKLKATVEAQTLKDFKEFMLSQKPENLVSLVQSAEYVMENALLYGDDELLKKLIHIGNHIGELADILLKCKQVGVRYGKPSAPEPAATERDRADADEV